MARGKVTVAADAAKLAEAKSEYGNVSRVVPISGGAEVYVRPASFTSGAGRGGRVVIRGQHVKSSHRLGTKAKGMKACAGKRGCDFEQCLTSAGITAPRSIRKACNR
jgi:hypothetical protein